MQDQILSVWHKPYMPKRVPKTPEMAEKAVLIGQRICQIREQKGYTQLTLAAKVKVTPGAIGQYETGRNLPRMKILERLAVELDVSTEWLMTGDDPGESVKAHTTTERDALVIIRSIPVDLHEAALAMLRGLAEKKPEK
jgi:transcriptional regulator with XRE-family HTH domain